MATTDGHPFRAVGSCDSCVARVKRERHRTRCGEGVGARGEEREACAKNAAAPFRPTLPPPRPHTIPQVDEYKTHRIDPPPTTVTTSRGELLGFFETMFRMRRLEIAADMQYKAKLIRGFCHL